MVALQACVVRAAVWAGAAVRVQWNVCGGARGCVRVQWEGAEGRCVHGVRWEVRACVAHAAQWSQPTRTAYDSIRQNRSCAVVGAQSPRRCSPDRAKTTTAGAQARKKPVATSASGRRKCRQEESAPRPQNCPEGGGRWWCVRGWGVQCR